MKAIVPRAVLISHKKSLRAAKPRDRKTAAESSVSLSVAEVFSVEIFGFSDRMECESLEWGSAVLPYVLWSRLMENIKLLAPNEKVPIEAKDGMLILGSTQVTNPKVRLVKARKSVFDIPFNADRMTMIHHVFAHDVETLKDSGAWQAAETMADDILGDLRRAFEPLEKYGVKKQDLAEILMNRIQVKEPDALLEALREAERDRNG